MFFPCSSQRRISSQTPGRVTGGAGGVPGAALGGRRPWRPGKERSSGARKQRWGLQSSRDPGDADEPEGLQGDGRAGRGAPPGPPPHSLTRAEPEPGSQHQQRQQRQQHSRRARRQRTRGRLQVRAAPAAAGELSERAHRRPAAQPRPAPASAGPHPAPQGPRRAGGARRAQPDPDAPRGLPVGTGDTHGGRGQVGSGSKRPMKVLCSRLSPAAPLPARTWAPPRSPRLGGERRNRTEGPKSFTWRKRGAPETRNQPSATTPHPSPPHDLIRETEAAKDLPWTEPES